MVFAEPGVVLLRGETVVAAGSPESVGHVEGVEIVECPDEAILPALVNAHTHLDLTHIGMLPFGGSFLEWLEQVISRRRIDEEGIADSVREGVRLSQAGGVAAVGDIAGVWSEAPRRVVEEGDLRGVSFVEVFGLGARQNAATARLMAVVERHGRVPEGAGPELATGVQPHAPYSCGLELYLAAGRLASERNLPLATHLAESPEEIEFARSRSGPLAAWLDRKGVLDDSVRPLGDHPLDALCAAGVFERGRWLLVHLNCLEAGHVALLARLGASVVYCPRASRYFGHPRSGWSPHRYRELIAAGVRVVLGTDSLICLDTPDRITPLDDARLLWRRDGTSPRALLGMMTTEAAVALGLEPAPFTLASGRSAGLIGVPISHAGLEGVMSSRSSPRWLLGGPDAT